jgi:hypothetical protein
MSPSGGSPSDRAGVNLATLAVLCDRGRLPLLPLSRSDPVLGRLRHRDRLIQQCMGRGRISTPTC